MLSSHGKSWKKLISILVIVAVFYYLFDNLLSSYQKLSERHFEVIYTKLSISFALLLFTFLFNPIAWMKIMNSMHEDMDYRKSFSIYYASQLGKYLPGRIWAYAGQVYLAQTQGFSGEKTLVSSVLFQIISTAISVYFFIITLLFWTQFPLFARGSFVLLVTVSGLAMLRLDLLKKLTGIILNRFLKRSLQVDLTNGAVIYSSILLMMSWATYAIAYHQLINSFYPIDMITGIKFTGIYAISWLIGYFSLLTPGGLGIREGIQVYLLSLFIPLPVSIVISLACRLWLTVGEVTVAGIAFLMLRKNPSAGSIEPGKGTV